jgi:hypothetical protein
MTETNQEDQETNSISLPVNWHFPENLQSRYANLFLAQTGQFEVIISFFEAQLPILLGQTEENKTILEQQGSIKAECVSKVVLSPEVIPTLITALQETLERYHAAKGK